MEYDITNCRLCPRKCGTDRTVRKGICGADSRIMAARAALHHWEEPCISGTNGSGTVFFSGCTLKCCFCQNYNISTENHGMEISTERLGEIFLELQDKKAHNINLVNPTHYVPWIIKAIDMIRPKLQIPIVYNSGGYETIETLEMLEGYVDIFLPDLKYYSAERSARYSKAENYFEYASQAILKMADMAGEIVIDENGIMQKGLIIRHLVMPTGRHDSMKLMDWINENIPHDSFMISLMSQYTPIENCINYPEINRRTATMEYNSVVNHVEKYDFNGFIQERSSAAKEYTPPFDFEGLQKSDLR
ncbi:MAG: radical SAM protein [Oscillospiraceae bacterium]